MRRFNPVISGIIGVAVLALFLCLLGFGIWRLLQAVFSLEKEITGAIIATVGAIVLGFGTVVGNQRHSKNQEIRESHRPQKIEVYKRFMDTAVVATLREAGTKDEQSANANREKELKDFFHSFTADLILWGSQGVLKAWRKFRVGTIHGGANPLLLLDDILREIRSDLGNSNRGLNRGDLTSLFLKDPDELKSQSKGK